MERIVPTTASEEVELYLRTIYSLLRSTAEVQVRTLEETHAGVNSSLHLEARSTIPDISALTYTWLRLPDCMPQVRSVILGQSSTVFCQHGFDNVETWQEVPARARRRRCYFNGKDAVACYIASRSDIDDMLPTLTAYQIEWNKLNLLLQRCKDGLLNPGIDNDRERYITLADRLEISVEDLDRLRVIWGSNFTNNLNLMASQRCHLHVRLLDGSLSEYLRATRAWMENIVNAYPQIIDRPVYFVSSNPHSVTNLLSGFAFRCQDELLEYVHQADNESLLAEWDQINKIQPEARGNFLFYVLKKYQTTEAGKHLIDEQLNAEKECGIYRIPSLQSFEVDAQVIELSKIQPHWLDPRISNEDSLYMFASNALILNIDYPLGLAAYNILTRVAETAGDILGVYIMGKAATLNGVRGDVMMPNVVQDEHSLNTYMFQNCFNASDITPYLMYGSVLDNQKAVSVLGTFLQNTRVMDIFYREGYTDLEMEAGPYLSAIYEMFRPKRHPVNEIVNLYGVPFDVGILHYASDTPMSKGKNLGAGTLSYQGMDSTYATSIAILRRIFQLERQRLKTL